MRRVLAAVVATVVLAACGVSGEDDAHRVSGEAVPFDLLAPPTTAAPTTTTTSTPNTTTVQLYFIVGEGLVELERELLPPVSAPRLLAELGMGPTEREGRQGIVTYLPEGSGVDGVTVTGGIASVSLGEEFLGVAPEDLRLALAQLVFTLTGRPGVGRVTFKLNGEPIDVPRGDGTLTSDSVSRDSYESIPVRT